MGGGGQADVHAGVAQAPLDQGLRPGGDTEGTQRRELGRAGLSAHELPLAERAHEQDAQAKVGGQRQDRALGLALAGLQGTWMASMRPVAMSSASSPKAAGE